MGFDLKGFRNAQCQARTDQVRVDGMADWFDEGDEPVFHVRGLSGEELARVREAVDKNKNISEVLEAIATSQTSQDRIDEIREYLGVSDSVPNELARRMEMLVYGSVDPNLDHETVKLVAERHPIELYNITDKILTLTGEGAQPLKKKDSSRTQE